MLQVDSMSRGVLFLLLASACSFDAAAPGEPPVTAADAPRFQVPFPCGESWQASTRPEHEDPDAEIDWEQPPSAGKQVVASASGTVTGSGTYQDGTSFVVIDHADGWSTRYLHMEVDSLAPLGAAVAAGDPIGLVGDVGAPGDAHLHYEQRYDGIPQPVLIEGEPIEVHYRPEFASYTSRTVCVDPDITLASRTDVDGDGHGDLTFHAKDANGNGELWVWRGTEDGFADTPLVPFTGNLLMANARIAVADVGADGFADVVLARPFDDMTELHLLRGSDDPHGFGSYVRDVPVAFDSLEMAAGDVTGDGFADLIVASNDEYELGEMRVYEGSEDGLATQPRVPFSGRFDMMQVRIAVADVTGDGIDDILIARPAGEAATTEIMLLAGGDELEGPGDLIVTLDRAFEDVQIAAGDLTGDRLADLLIHDRDVAGHGTLRLWRGEDGGLSEAPSDVFVDREDMGDLQMSVGDVTGDGRADLSLAVSHDDTVDLRLLAGTSSPQGTGVFVRTFERALDALHL